MKVSGVVKGPGTGAVSLAHTMTAVVAPGTSGNSSKPGTASRELPEAICQVSTALSLHQQQPSQPGVKPTGVALSGIAEKLHRRGAPPT